MIASRETPEEQLARARQLIREAPVDVWASAVAPQYVGTKPIFGDHHREFWEWVYAITDETPRAFIGCWPRDGAKSSSVELAILRLAGHRLRKYCVYFSRVQGAADEKVADLGKLFMSPKVKAFYPHLSAQHVTETGVKRDWRRSRIRCDGFTVDAMGLTDTAARGVRIDEDRPDLIVLDDIESAFDTTAGTRKLEEIITKSVIGARAKNAAIIFIQNLIHTDSVMARLLDGRADYLMDRQVSGPIPQVWDLQYTTEWSEELQRDMFRIVAGEPSWDVMDLKVSEEELNEMGPDAFLMEKQQETQSIAGDMFKGDTWVPVDMPEPGDLTAVCRSWDLAGTEGGGDYTVGTLMGLDKRGFVWILDMVRGQWNTAKVEDELVAASDADAEHWGNVAQGYTVVIEEQPGPGGDGWKRQLSNNVLAAHKTEFVKPTVGKAGRADAYSAKQQRGEIRLVRGPWNPPFIAEHTAFMREGGARHDDCVDTASQGHNFLVGAKPKRHRATVHTAAKRRLPNAQGGR